MSERGRFDGDVDWWSFDFDGRWLGLPDRALRMNARPRIDRLMTYGATKTCRYGRMEMLGIHFSPSGVKGLRHFRAGRKWRRFEK
jgi:hypothetical protein